MKRGLFESFLTVGEMITSLDVDNEQNHGSHVRVVLKNVLVSFVSSWSIQAPQHALTLESSGI